MSEPKANREAVAENQLIVCCAQTFIPTAQFEKVKELLERTLDWEYIQRIAARNGVLSLIARNLDKHFRESIPDDVSFTLREHNNANLQRNLFLTSNLIEVAELFETNGIPVLPFKGPLLAAQAYGDLSYRTYGDLDILVQPKDLEAAVNLLQGKGYTALSSIGWLNKTNWNVSSRKDIYFRSADGQINLELHWKLSGSHFALPFEMDRLWERLETIDIGGSELRTLRFDDLLIYLCMHGSRHSWERFAWVCDINELLRAQETVDWDQLLMKARALGCENVLGLGLYLIHRFFGRNFEFQGWEKILSDRVFIDLAEEIRSKLFSDQPVPFEIGDRYLYHLKLKENRLDRSKLHLHYALWYLRIIFTPKETDRSVFHFPPWLQPLYYVMRPLRLLYTYKMKPKKAADRN